MALRGLIKTGLAELGFWTRAVMVLGAVTGYRSRPLILTYHRVVRDFDRHAELSMPAMLVSTAMLERQLEWVARRYRFVSLDELGAAVASGTDGGPLAAVTFDDGYRDVYVNALPLLRRKGIPSAAFVVSDLIGSSQVAVHDRLYLALARSGAPARSAAALAALLRRLGAPQPAALALRTRDGLDALSATRLLLVHLPQAHLLRVLEALEGDTDVRDEELDGMRPLDWAELAEMQRGGMSIGSHSKSHAIFTREKRRQLAQEAAASRAALERGLGSPIHHFAYPDGRFDDAAVDAVAAAGYRYAYTTCPHRDPRRPLLTIPRIVFWERSCVDAMGRFSPAILSCHANGVFEILGRCDGDHGPRPRSAQRLQAPQASA